MNNIIEYLDELIPNPVCELNYKKDYELLIATVLSAQCTDKRVNEVTNILFKKYSEIETLKDAKIEDIKNIIRPCGNFNKKSEYILTIVNKLYEDYQGKVPNNFEYLIKLPGVGRKTIHVVLSELYNVPTIAVDTHVERVSKRLKLVRKNAKVFDVEKKLMKIIPMELWSNTHHQMVLFGRYICKAKKPECDKCLFYEDCFSKDKKIR